MRTSRGGSISRMAVVIIMGLAACGGLHAGVAVYDGGWSGGSDNGAPLATDAVVMRAGNLTWDTNTLPDTVASWVQESGYTGTVTFNTKYHGQGTFTNFTITGDCVISNGVWTHTANPAGTNEINRLSISVGGNLTIESNGSIDVTARGYATGYGPGKGTGSYYGGSYGGRGGLYTTSDGVAGPTYGSVYAPTNLGSSGSHIGGGGGLLLIVGGAVTNNGSIRANGASAWGGSGAGGSIYLRAGTLAGFGTIQANGGGDQGHSTGGGGRISLVVTNNGAGFSNYIGPVTAFGGVATDSARPRPSPGTVYRETAADTPNRGELTVDANGVASTADGGTVLNGREAMTYEFSRIVVTNRGNLGIASINTLTLTNTVIVGTSTNRTEGISVYGGTLTVPETFAFSNYYIRIYTNAGTVFTPQSLTVGTNGTLIVNGPHVLSNVTVEAGGQITHDANPAGASEPYKVNLTLAGNLMLDGGSIDVTGKGFPKVSGPGYGTGGYQGGSHGGPGGSYLDPSYGVAGPTYGSLVAPSNLGSGGGHHAGGGAVLLVVNGALTNNGSIIANGGSGQQGGAGGSVYLRVGTLAGSGIIQANGAGDSGHYAAGGGGRVSLVLTNSDASFDGYGGSVTAYGGARSSGNVPNGAGTIYRQDSTRRQLVIDKGVAPNDTGWTPMPASFQGSETYPAAKFVFEDDLSNITLVVTNKGRMMISNAITAAGLFVADTDEKLDLGSAGTKLTLTGDMTFGGTVYSKGGLYTLENLWNGQPGGVPPNVTGDGVIELWRPSGTMIMLR